MSPVLVLFLFFSSVIAGPTLSGCAVRFANSVYLEQGWQEEYKFKVGSAIVTVYPKYNSTSDPFSLCPNIKAAKGCKPPSAQLIKWKVCFNKRVTELLTPEPHTMVFQLHQNITVPSMPELGTKHGRKWLLVTANVMGCKNIVPPCTQQISFQVDPLEQQTLPLNWYQNCGGVGMDYLGTVVEQTTPFAIKIPSMPKDNLCMDLPSDWIRMKLDFNPCALAGGVCAQDEGTFFHAGDSGCIGTEDRQICCIPPKAQRSIKSVDDYCNASGGACSRTSECGYVDGLMTDSMACATPLTPWSLCCTPRSNCPDIDDWSCCKNGRYLQPTCDAFTHKPSCLRVNFNLTEPFVLVHSPDCPKN